MSIPKTTKLTLKRIVEGLNDSANAFGTEPQKLSSQEKAKLQEMASMFETYGQVLQNEDAIKASAQGLTELCNLAEKYATSECSEIFQKNIVDKDMKELKKRVMEYGKVATECYARMQQLGVAYQDIGHVLGRYYNLKSTPQPGGTNTAVKGMGQGEPQQQLGEIDIEPSMDLSENVPSALKKK